MRLEELNKQAEDPDLWNDPEAAQKVMRERGALEQAIGAFSKLEQSLEDALVREVDEEAGIELRDIQYVSSQPWPFPASSMCGFYAEATSREYRLSDELEEIRWFTTDELTAAVMDGSVILSPPVSIAFRLLADWFHKQCGGDLDAIVREARRQRGK